MPLVASGSQVREMPGRGGACGSATGDHEDVADRVPGRRAAEHASVSHAL